MRPPMKRSIFIAILAILAVYVVQSIFSGRENLVEDHARSEGLFMDHGEIQAEARKRWKLGEASLSSFIESLDLDPDRMVVLYALESQFSESPEYFSTWIETLPSAASRNSMKEDLLNQLAFDKGSKEAVDFVFANTSAEPQRNQELYYLYLSWFKRDADGAIQDAKRLNSYEDIRVFGAVLEEQKRWVNLHTLEVAEAAGLEASLLKKIAELAYDWG